MSSGDFAGWISAGDVNALKEALSKDDVKSALDAVCNANGEYPIHLAAIGRDVQIVETLLSAGCNPNQGSDEEGSHNGYTAAHIAAGNGDVDILESLAAHKANFDLPAADNWYALHVAAYKGKLPTMKTLLENGANIDCTNSFGQTPLVFAVAHGRARDVRFLLKHGASTQLHDPRGDSIMHHAFFYQMSKLFEGTYEVAEAQLDVAVVLILGGAEPSLTNDDGREATFFLKEELPSVQRVVTLLADASEKLLRSPVEWNFMSLVSAMPSTFTALGMNEAQAVELCEAVQQLNAERVALKKRRAEGLPAGACPVMNKKKTAAEVLADIPAGSDPSDGKCPFFQKRNGTAAAAAADDRPLCPFSVAFVMRHQRVLVLMCASFVAGFLTNQAWRLHG